MIGLLMLAGELIRGARPSRALAKPPRFRELQQGTSFGDCDQIPLRTMSSRSRDAIAHARDGRAPRSCPESRGWMSQRPNCSARIAHSLTKRP